MTHVTCRLTARTGIRSGTYAWQSSTGYLYLFLLSAGVVSKPPSQVAQAPALRGRRHPSSATDFSVSRPRPRPRRISHRQDRSNLAGTDSLCRQPGLLAGTRRRRILSPVSHSPGSAILRGPGHLVSARWRLRVLRSSSGGPRKCRREIKVS